MDFIYNFFLGSSFRGNGLELVRARAFICFSLLFITLFISNIALYSVIIDVSEYSRKFNLLVNLALLIINFSCLMTIRFTGHLLLPVNFSVFWAGLILCFLSYLNGGPANSFIIWLCWLPALTAFTFAGRNSGVFWSVVILIFYSSMLALHLNDYAFTQVLEKEQLRPGVFSTWYIGFISIVLLAFFSNQMLVTMGGIRDGNYDLIHQRIDKLNSHSDMPYELVENYLYHAIKRHDSYADKLTLVVVSLQIESKDESLIQAVNEETLRRLHKLVRSTDLAVQLNNGYFVVMVENISSLESAAVIKDALSRLFYKPYAPTSNTSIKVTPHLVTHVYPDDGTDIEDMTALLRRRIKR